MSGNGSGPSNTLSPQPAAQPSSGPNPVFKDSPPKKRGGQCLSSTNKKCKRGPRKSQEVSMEDASQIMLEKLKEAGCETIYQFFEDFFASTDRETSWQASKLMNDHGDTLLDLLHAKQPDVVTKWALKTSYPVIAAEGKRLAELVHPDRTRTFASRSETWSLERLLAEAMIAAPNLCEVLMVIGMTSDVGRRDNKLVLITVLCMLAQSENERAVEFQEIMGTYFIACGTPQRQFDVLAHAGLTVSYTKAIADLKGLSAEGLAPLHRMVQEKACMIVWDNLNIMFKVAKQRRDSKDTFENGTTATLIALYGVLRGELELEILPPRTLPSVQQVIQTRIPALWHVHEFLLVWFPSLRGKFGQEHGDVPVVKVIPLHRTEQYPMPAMKIDESSLDGTIEVIDTAIIRTLQMNEAGMQAHGAIAARREDTNLLDRYGSYLHGMLGLFHVALSGTRGMVNEHWGEPNSKFPGSLWTQNSFLSRKAISAGWKAKKLPPFRPTYELMLKISLPAHILDAF
ncbi:hypothetical protein B0H10DRAFT_1950239 [Mycena sp. CBHHK59/15]|nr:hypothetical protein B0H10DRAFT_1950239 [Mycena sp. CBHHK59/15]